jgi:hypothetical protein
VYTYLLDSASRRYRDSDVFTGVVKASVPFPVEVDLSTLGQQPGSLPGRLPQSIQRGLSSRHLTSGCAQNACSCACPGGEAAAHDRDLIGDLRPDDASVRIGRAGFYRFLGYEG